MCESRVLLGRNEVQAKNHLGLGQKGSVLRRQQKSQLKRYDSITKGMIQHKDLTDVV